MTNKKVFTVNQVNKYLKNIIENDILLSHIDIKGEISNFKLHSSGHAYFTLKDSESRLKCVMFKSNTSKLKFMPEDGMSVIVKGRFSIYERDGQYQLYASNISPEGIGELYKAYEQLKNNLSSLGYFKDENKKKIPFLPQNIGVVTSPTGAAVRDIISIIKRRCSFANIILNPVQVQGEIASIEIARAIKQFNKLDNVDVIIIGRGGGSIEELWAFNEEKVAQAIYESNIPIISAVGHETDFTIADFVADLRAATPSSAAELVVPDVLTLSSKINQTKFALKTNMNMFLNTKKLELEKLYKDNTFNKIEQKIASMTQTVDILNRDLVNSMKNIINTNKNNLVKNIEKLDILNPASSLLRGYSVVRKSNNKIISSVKNIDVNEVISVELKDGLAKAQVLEINKNA